LARVINPIVITPLTERLEPIPLPEVREQAKSLYSDLDLEPFRMNPAGQELPSSIRATLDRAMQSHPESTFELFAISVGGVMTYGIKSSVPGEGEYLDVLTSRAAVIAMGTYDDAGNLSWEERPLP
jgi:hypothetical protein